MIHEIQAVYEAGVLRPLAPLALEELELVSVTVRSKDDNWLDADVLALAEREGDSTISLAVVRERLAGIKGSLAETAIAERGECY